MFEPSAATPPKWNTREAVAGSQNDENEWRRLPRIESLINAEIVSRREISHITLHFLTFAAKQATWYVPYGLV